MVKPFYKIEFNNIKNTVTSPMLDKIVSFGILYSILGFIITFPMIFIQYFRFKITTQYLIKIPQIKYHSYEYGNTPCGWIVGNNFIGYCDYVMTYGSPSFTLYYIEKRTVTQSQNTIEIYTTNANDRNKCIYKLTHITNLPLTAYKHQQGVINNIINEYKKNNKVVSFIYGTSGTGKSSIALLICDVIKIQKTVRYFEFNCISSSSQTFDDVYLSRQHINEPFIILMDEIDLAIERLHQTTSPVINRNGENLHWLNNKYDWNVFLDKIAKGFYKNIIIIMTSNKSVEWFNNLDPSYLRNGRIDITHELIAKTKST